MKRPERWNALLELLARDGRIEVDEAAAELTVSAATIRRDLDELAQQQMLTRTRGGAVAHNLSYDLPLRYKTARRAPEKQRIGAAVARLVEPGSIVGLNGGTTTTEAARAIATRGELTASDGGPGVTIVTNALNIASELAVRPQVKIVLTGGVARPQSFELMGPLATGVLAEVSLDLAVLGVDALDAAQGATAHHEGEASINHLMAARAARVAVVADSSKLGRRAFARICPLDTIDVLVTDTGADDERIAPYAEAGVEVIRA
ncbi:DeoR/GlpR family DNA-binding transcription regulator [Streptomyces sp. NPDC048636]|uniref:DeoR/GlpR family DNA-binding transcription regulator n=1 Tax=Streptomyces sp. NPDC048636 TaxID=3155762 RepID=UPI003440F9C2